MTWRTDNDGDNAVDVHPRSVSGGYGVARPPWAVLISGYLIIHGSVFVLGTLLWQFTGFGLGPAIQHFRDEYDWSPQWAWVVPCHGGFSLLSPLIAFIAGIWMSRRPASLSRLALPVAVVMAVAGSLGIAAYFTDSSVSLSPVSAWLFSFVRQLPPLLVPLFVLWCVRGVERLRQPEVTLIAGYLLLVGGVGIASSPIVLGNGGRSVWLTIFPLSGWSISHMFRLATLLFPIVLFLCGVLQMRRPLRAVAVAAIVLAVTLLHSWQLAEELYWMYLSIGSVLAMAGALLQGPGYSVALAVFLLAFAIRYRHRFGRQYPDCVECGYNLTGLTEPRCPECGTAFALPGDEGACDRGEA